MSGNEDEVKPNIESENAVSIGRKKSTRRRKEIEHQSQKATTSTNQEPLHAGQLIQIDNEDESLRKYKESLLGPMADLKIDASKKAKLDLIKISIVCEEDNINQTYSTEDLSKNPIRIKQDTTFDIHLEVLVSFDVLVGLRYNHLIKKMGIKMDETSEIIGSYAPKSEKQTLKIRHLHTPSGILGRGQYQVNSALTDDDGTEHLSWDWTLKVCKNWVMQGSE